MNRLEALVDAISACNGSKDPEGHGYQARNPLLLKYFKGGVYRDRLRHFSGWQNGYKAALFDLKVKCSGKSRAKLDGTIKGLMRAYSLPDQTSLYVVRFLRKALKDPAIKEITQLSYFMENGDA